MLKPVKNVYNDTILNENVKLMRNVICGVFWSVLNRFGNLQSQYIDFKIDVGLNIC